MNFLKQNHKYINKQLEGNISNGLTFSIKSLHRQNPRHKSIKQQSSEEEEQQLFLCEKCEGLLTERFCLFCEEDSSIQFAKKVSNQTFVKECQKEFSSVQCIILMVDISGSMNFTYVSSYQKVNQDSMLKVLGSKNYEYLKGIIGEAEVKKNFQGIQTFLESGETIQDIGYALREELRREAKSSPPVKNEMQSKLQYISRKEIIEIGVDRFISSIRNKRPNTLITVVYFNSNIEIPTHDFADCTIIPDIESRTLEEMVALGEHYATQISISPISKIGDSLVQNMTKMEPQGQTAMTPCLAFCLGLAKYFKYNLHQIVIVTDGLSNIGFGQTEDPLALSESKQIFRTLAETYAVKYNCVVNAISFEDCAIGYEAIDQIIKSTEGLPYCIQLQQNEQEKIITPSIISSLNIEMNSGFCESTKQFCYENKLAVKISNPKVKIIIPEHLEKQATVHAQNWVSLEMGVKSVNQKFEFYFTTLQQQFKDLYMKFTILHQFKRGKSINYVIRQELIRVEHGNEEQAIQSEAKVLTKQIENKIYAQIDCDDLNTYSLLDKKLEKVEVTKNIDVDILEKLKKRKAELEEYEKNTDKLSKDKKSMKSRRTETYNKRKEEQDDVFDC